MDHGETFFKIILENMDKVKEALRNAPLPYINWLIKQFEYYKIPLKDEECIQVVDTMINEEKLEALNFKCICSRQWLHKDNHTKKSISPKPIKPTFDQDLPHYVVDILSHEILD